MDKDRVLILGDGFLGNTFRRHGYKNIWGRDKFEFPNPEAKGFGKIIASGGFDVIINAIALSDTRFCEVPDNWNTVHETNGMLPRYLSTVCKKYDVKFVQISTGCLYDTVKIPQAETVSRAAHCNYVVSKWVGELYCDPDRDLIIRPRLLFDSERPDEGKRNNLICKMEKFTKFIDEKNTVTSTDTIVEAIEALLVANQLGVFNVGQLGSYTLVDMAEYLGFEVTGKLTAEQLRANENLALVNNVMDLSKLRQFYEPRDALIELERCWNILRENT